MGDFVQLPTADPSFIEVRQLGDLYRVLLVTPLEPGPSIAAMLVATADPEIAVDYGRHVAESMRRPLRLPKGLRR